MLHAKLQTPNGRKETSFVAPSSKCLQILNRSENDSAFTLAVASGNALQLANIHITSTTANNDVSSAAPSPTSSSLRVRTGAELCLDLFPASSTRISSTALLTSSSILCASTTSSSSTVLLSVVDVDAEKLNGFLHEIDSATTGRRQREDDESSDTNGVLKIKSSFAASNNDTSSSPLLVSGSGGGSNYIGLDFVSSHQIFLTNGINRTSSIIDIETQKSVASFSHHDGFVISTCTLPNFASSSSSANKIVAVNTGSFITLWDSRQAAPISSNGNNNNNNNNSRSPLYTSEAIITCMTPFVSSASSPSDSQHLLLTGASDRSITLWDMRKWTKQHVANSTLKFAPASIAAATATTSSSETGGFHGNFVTAAGSDSEVRNLWIPSDQNNTNGQGVNNNKNDKNKNKDSNGKKEDALPENFNGATGGSFRQRLQDATHCATSWYGSWVSSSSASSNNSNLSFTLGMSRDYEIFLAKF